jgi:hypothetical protein
VYSNVRIHGTHEDGNFRWLGSDFAIETSEGQDEIRRLTNKLDRHIKPMKLLLWAIRADSLIDIEARPLD